MTEFFIFGVYYSKEERHIDWLQIGFEDDDKELNVLGPISRLMAVRLIETGSASFRTIVKSEKSGKFKRGSEVKVMENEFLTTAPDHSEENNLENLPKFFFPETEIEESTINFFSKLTGQP